MNRFSSPPAPPDFPAEAAPHSGMFDDSAMESRRVRIDMTAEEVLLLALGLRSSMIGSTRRNYRSYAEASERARLILAVLQTICSTLGCKLVSPGFPAVSPTGPEQQRFEAMQRVGRNWCAGITKQLATDRIGRLELLGNDAVRFSFYEVTRQCGIWTDHLSRTKFTHELVDAKAYPLPGDHVPQPRKAKRIVRQLMAVPELARSCRIVAGMQVSKASRVSDQWREDTPLARGVKAVGAGFGAALATVASLAKPLGTMATAVAAADPAIVLGDVVFYGWD